MEIIKSGLVALENLGIDSNTQRTILLVFAIIIILLIARKITGKLIVRWFHKKAAVVKQTSKRLLAMEELNKRYGEIFHTIKEPEPLVIQMKYKKGYNMFRFEGALVDYLKRNMEYMDGLVKNTEANNKAFREYMKEFGNLPEGETKESVKNNDATAGIPFRAYHFIENNIYEKGQLSPVTGWQFKITVKYRSTSGKNQYSKSHTFSFQEVKQYTVTVREGIASTQYQRALMSDKLRYAILKRDNFTCQICGRSTRDGAKLHVDHIRPVSKGGTTVPENLRTLCEQCNLGKSDQYDPTGLN